jgi:hypothetical protein
MGDAAFVLTDHMVTPFRRACHSIDLPKVQHCFNQALASSQVVVEHPFGMLKMRFQSLHGLRTQIDTQIDWIWACV